MKREAILKGKLMQELRLLPGFLSQRHEDKFVSGWPDISVSGYRRTSWWEVKHATPDWEQKDLQTLTCRRLAVTSFHCRFIFYHEHLGERRVLIVHPDNYQTLTPEAWCEGFDHPWVAAHIQMVHVNDLRGRDSGIRGFGQSATG